MSLLIMISTYGEDFDITTLLEEFMMTHIMNSLSSNPDSVIELHTAFMLHETIIIALMENNKTHGLVQIDSGIYRSSGNLSELHLPLSPIFEFLNISDTDKNVYSGIFLEMIDRLLLQGQLKENGQLYECDMMTKNGPSKEFTVIIRPKNSDLLLRSYEKSLLGVLCYSQYLQKVCPNAYILSTATSPVIKRASSIVDYLDSGCPLGKANAIKGMVNDLSLIMGAGLSPSEFRLMLVETVLKSLSPCLMLKVSVSKRICTITVNKVFETLFQRGLKSNMDMVGFFLVHNVGKSLHANFIVLDKKLKTAERFEPNGGVSIQGTGDLIDECLEDYFAKIGFQYIKPTDFEDAMGVQSIEGMFPNVNGFCVTWCVLYAEKRLQNGLSAIASIDRVMKDEIKVFSTLSTSNERLGELIEKSIIGQIHYILSKVDSASLSSFIGCEMSVAVLDSELCLVKA